MDNGINNIWDFLTWLWASAVDFLNTEISGFGLDFTLWEWALGSAILYLILYAISCFTVRCFHGSYCIFVISAFRKVDC